MGQAGQAGVAAQRETPVPPGYSRGAPVPWWVKLGVKLGLAAIGVHGARARAIGIARPSFDQGSAQKLVRVPSDWMAMAERMMGRRPRTVLELGPGGMVVRAPVLHALGLQRIWYCDPADSAPTDPAAYAQAAALAREAGLVPPAIEALPDRATILEACNATLLIGGPEALRAIPDASVDLVISEVVLEHVRRADLAPLLAELRRVTAPDGLGLHWIDLHDHLGGGLQHLRFGEGFWEGPLAARAGLYVNRLGLSQFVAAFAAAGFATEVLDALVWPAPPPGPRSPHPQSRRPAADDRVCNAFVALRPGH